MTDLKRIADALERIADALETSKIHQIQDPEFDEETRVWSNEEITALSSNG